MKYNNDQSLVIVSGKNYFGLNIIVHYVEARIERIIWIGFYKNKDNNKCLIHRLPKDLIIYILNGLLGKQSLTPPYIKITQTESKH